MILEQSIGIVATAIAQEFARAAPAGKATKWTEAAKQLRFPFWDWTLPDYVDKVCSWSWVEVRQLPVTLRISAEVRNLPILLFA